MKISEIMVLLAMSIFLTSANVGITGSISFIFGLAILMTSIANKKEKDNIK